MISKLLFFVRSAHMRSLLSFLQRLEEWGGLKPTDSDPHCLCTAPHLQWEVTQSGWYTHINTQTHTHTIRLQGAYAAFTFRKLGWKSRLQRSWKGRAVCVCVGVCMCVRIFTFATAKWGLNLAYRLFGGYSSSDCISCLLSSTMFVAVCAKLENAELFTPAVFLHPVWISFTLTELDLYTQMWRWGVGCHLHSLWS